MFNTSKWSLVSRLYSYLANFQNLLSQPRTLERINFILIFLSQFTRSIPTLSITIRTSISFCTLNNEHIRVWISNGYSTNPFFPLRKFSIGTNIEHLLFLYSFVLHYLKKFHLTQPWSLIRTPSSLVINFARRKSPISNHSKFRCHSH